MAVEQSDRRKLTPLVVKVGGSLMSNACRLSAVISTLARARRPIVVVPGGGPFADQVRDAQTVHDTSERACHLMALLAMHQMGLLIEDMQARCVAADTLTGIRLALDANRVPIWLPLKLAGTDETIAADWSVTSDALAAWLAEQLGFEAVLLVKSRCVPQGATADELAAEGIVDRVFGDVIMRAGLAFRILGPGEERMLAEICLAPKQMANGSRNVRRFTGRVERPRRVGRRVAGGVGSHWRHWSLGDAVRTGYSGELTSCRHLNFS